MKKILKLTKDNYKWIILSICLILFLALAEDVFNKEIMQVDTIGYNFVKTYLIKEQVTPIMKIITFFGGATCLIGLTILLFIIIKNKKIGLLIGPRPTENRIINENGYSFPSGHSMISMAFYGFLIYLIYKYVKNKKLKYISITLISILIIFIGISRIYLGVHYTSDVLAGFLFSISYLIIYVLIANNKVLNKNSK